MTGQHADESLLDATIRVPDHVVHRAFVAETVVLNLRTGRYHGLNPSAGRMLEELERGGSAREVAGALAEEYGQPRDVLERDLLTFCRDLLERKLIEIENGTGH
jgi:Coenzyme PQQ synthesis protein D (PqqD)